MKIIIKIECDTISEFYSHLTKLRRQVKAKAKAGKLDPATDEFRNAFNLDDNNCYGTHEVKIIPT